MSITRFPRGVSSFGVPVVGAGPILTTGSVFFVDSNTGSDGNSGTDPTQPFATLDYAIGRCTADKADHIIIMPGHAESVSASIAVDVAGITIRGLGNGENRPAFTNIFAGDMINVSVDDVTIENIYSPASTTAACTARINVAGAQCTIRNCHFKIGASDTTDVITIAAAGIACHVVGCHFQVTANGCSSGVVVESAAAINLVVRDCWFDGMNTTNAFDVAGIESAVAHLDCLIANNVFYEGEGIVFSTAATGLIVGNLCGGGTLDSMIDPGSCFCLENYNADAIDESGVLVPVATAS